MNIKSLISLCFITSLIFAGCKEEDVILPTTITNQPSEITPMTAVYSGEIVSTGNVQIFDYGFVWSTSELPTTESSSQFFNKTGVVGKFEFKIDGLSPSTKYYLRTVLNTNKGIQYGNQVSFETLAVNFAEFKTLATDEITITTATIKGEITSLGNITILDHGFVWSKTELPTTESNTKLLGKPVSTGSVQFAVSNLEPFTEYFVRTVVITPSGILYGNQEKFRTLQITINTNDAYDVKYSSGFIVGQLENYGSIKVLDFGFVWSSSHGVNLSNSNKVTFGTNTNINPFDFKLIELNELTTYYYNTYLETEFGIVYGSEKSFKTKKGPWTRIADFPGIPRTNAITFTINGKGYVGLGNGEGFVPLNDLWEYDPVKNEWTRKNDFKGEARSASIAFTISNKAYVGTGAYSSTYDDMWEYSPAEDQWIQKANFPGGQIYYATSFSIGSTGYVGTGIRNGSLLNEFWQYDASNDSWTAKQDFPGTAVDVAVGFSIGNEGYIGTGNLKVGSSKEFWSYSAINDKWEKKNSLPSERWNSVGFTLFNFGYIGLGNGVPTDIFWKYDPSIDSWTTGPVFPGGQREGASAFVINNKAYIGLGAFGKRDFWEYNPSAEN